MEEPTPQKEPLPKRRKILGPQGFIYPGAKTQEERIQQYARAKARGAALEAFPPPTTPASTRAALGAAYAALHRPQCYLRPAYRCRFYNVWEVSLYPASANWARFPARPEIGPPASIWRLFPRIRVIEVQTEDPIHQRRRPFKEDSEETPKNRRITGTGLNTPNTWKS